jgi:pentatricopeptide repeat protein
MGAVSASAVIACAAAYDAEEAVKVLFRMEERQIDMHKFVYHHVMTALASAGDIEQALMIWHHMDVRPQARQLQNTVRSIRLCILHHFSFKSECPAFFLVRVSDSNCSMQPFCCVKCFRVQAMRME